MSQLYVDNIRNRTGGPIGIPTGAVVTGVVTATTGNITGNLTVGGNADITGVLTYEDVTNVDSVGVVTARSGIEFGASGVGGTITATGQAEFAGVCTASSFSGPFSGDLSIDDKIIHTGDTTTAIRFPANNTVTVDTNGVERLRVDSTTGRLLLNTASTIASEPGEGHNPILQVAHVSGNVANLGISVSRFQASNPNSVPIILQKSRNDTIGSHTIVVDDDELGRIEFAGSDGSNFRTAAAITGEVDGTPGSSDMPGRLEFKTTADGATSPTERLRITSGGGFHFTNGELIERAKVTAGKLSDNTNIDLENGMVHLFTTQETTTSTPNIRINSSTSLNSVMAVGEMISVTLITTAAAAGYSAQLTIDGNAVTENWTGGSAPDAGGSSGVDIHAYTIIKTADATFTVIATQTTTS